MSLQQNSVPLLSGGKDAKSLIVMVLSKEFPLSAKQVFQRIQKQEPTASLTYQGVHKALGHLAVQGVISKDEKGAYQLNIEWAKSVKKFGENIENVYSFIEKPPIADIPIGTSKTYVFSSLMETLYWFLSEMEYDYISNPVPDVSMVWWYHVWPITNISKKEFIKIKNIMKHGKHYALCRGGTNLDKILASFWIKLGKHFICGVNCAENGEVLVFRDYYIQLLLPNKVKRKLDNFFEKNSTINETNLIDLYKLYFEKETPIRAVVMHDKSMADEVRKEGLQQYNQLRRLK